MNFPSKYWDWIYEVDIKNSGESDILLNLQASKLTCYEFMKADRRCKAPGSVSKNFINHNDRQHNLHVHASFPWPSSPTSRCRKAQKDVACESSFVMSHKHSFAPEGNIIFLILIVNKPAFGFRRRKNLYFVFFLYHWKDSPKQKPSVPLLTRYTKMSEFHGKLFPTIFILLF